MSDQTRREIENLAQTLRIYGPSTFHNLLTALVIWLFGVLVFIPLASSLNWQTELLSSLIIFAAFTVFMYQTASGFRKLIDAFSFLPARKYGLKRGITQEEGEIIFKRISYIISTVTLYALYFPFLRSFHFAISGIVLVVVLIGIFFFTLRVLSILFANILEHLTFD